MKKEVILEKEGPGGRIAPPKIAGGFGFFWGGVGSPVKSCWSKCQTSTARAAFRLRGAISKKEKTVPGGLDCLGVGKDLKSGALEGGGRQFRTQGERMLGYRRCSGSIAKGSLFRVGKKQDGNDTAFIRGKGRGVLPKKKRLIVTARARVKETNGCGPRRIEHGKEGE